MDRQEHKVERRLVAIFAADVAGYSRLMSQDEIGTLRTLTAHREIMDRLIAEHGGRIANTAGDSVMAEFPSAVDAVQCAVSVQEALAQTTQDNLEDQRLQFRIGVHVGDVMVRGGDLLGDGVNVAARLQSLADPGGICISAATHEYVRKNLMLAYTDLGPQSTKNIEEPIQTFAITSNGIAPATAHTTLQSKASPLPDQPFIAVLPFDNMSPDPDQEYLADGIVEDITAALSRVRSFFVIARNSTFTYKKQAFNIQQGSLDAYDLVMRALPYVWSLERDANLKATQILQDALRLDPTYPTALSLAAWCCGQRVLYNWSEDTALEKQETLRLAQQAAALSSNDAFVLAVLGAALSITSEFRKAGALLERALVLDPNSAFAWARSGWLKKFQGHSDAAIQCFEQALRLSPFDPMVSNWYVGIGSAHFQAGRYEQAVEWQEKALFSNPATWMYRGLIPSYVFAGHLDKAKASLRELLRAYPGLTIAKVRAAMDFNKDYTARLVEGLRRAGLPE